MPAREVGLPEELPAELAAGLAGHPDRAGGPRRLPGGGGRRGRAGGGRSHGCPSWTGPTSSSSPSTRRARGTSTRPCTSPATAAAIVVSYAIADVAAFVAPGDPVDVEARRRGMTLYAPDHRTPLHPPAAQRGRGQPAARPGPAGRCCGRIRPRRPGQADRGRRAAARWCAAAASSSYAEAQDDDRRRHRPRESLALLPRGRHAGGEQRERRPRRRQPADPGPGDRDRRRTATGSMFRAPLPVEGWNAQISLLTGMAAAHLMLYGADRHPADAAAGRPAGRCAGCGRRPRHSGSAGRRSSTTATFVRGLDPKVPPHAAMLHACTVLFRGAGYRAFTAGVPDEPSTPRWRWSTPMSPRRCGAWSTATPARSASRCAPTGRCRTGCCERWTGCPRRWRRPSAGPSVRAGDHRPGGGLPAQGPRRRGLLRARWSMSTASATGAP